MATKRNSEKKVVMSTAAAAAAAPARRNSSTSKRATRSTTDTLSTPEVVSRESVIELTNSAVADLAYSYWEARGYQGGSPEEDWLRAEQELRAATASK